ncbi:hypothetical protein ACLQ3C_09200 [Gordonia sp. DT30]|uniref:hypothetical protein n=1 Tax=unclassified Gordonia (in: high G+C Gram-positive bacteria) TaxID=2657482 RepID=UPI003CEECEFC
MSDDNLSIRPEAVKSTGHQLDSLSSEATIKTNTFFTSQEPAAAANPGFAAGPALTAYSSQLHDEINKFIRDLAANARSIIDAAQTIAAADEGNTTGFNRELSALNGLTKPPLPGA